MTSTLDPSNTDTTHGTLSGGNLVYTTTATGSFGSSRGTDGATTGKFYFEAALSLSSGNALIGSCDGTYNVNGNTFLGSSHSIGWQTGSGAVFTSYGTQTAKGTLSNGQTACIAIDVGAALIWFRVNAGNWNNDATANPATGTNGLALGSQTGSIFPCVTVNSGGVNHWTVNFGGTSYAQTPPSGFGNWGASTLVSLAAFSRAQAAGIATPAGKVPILGAGKILSRSQVGIGTFLIGAATLSPQQRSFFM